MAQMVAHLQLQIEALCLRFGVKRLELFGSAARGGFDAATSDYDFLVEFHEGDYRGSARQYFGLLHALEDLLGRRVDLVEVGAITNCYFLREANRHKVLLYAA
jgi:hypothetical protein